MSAIPTCAICSRRPQNPSFIITIPSRPSSMMSPFTCFQRLPAEIRLMIWEMALEEAVPTYRLATIRYSPQLPYIDTDPAPTLLHVSYEAREEALKCFQQEKITLADKSQLRLFVRPGTKTIQLDPGFSRPDNMSAEGYWGEFLKKFSVGANNIFTHVGLRATCTSEPSGHNLLRLLKIFPNIEIITLVVTGTIIGLETYEDICDYFEAIFRVFEPQCAGRTYNNMEMQLWINIGEYWVKFTKTSADDDIIYFPGWSPNVVDIKKSMPRLDL